MLQHSFWRSNLPLFAGSCALISHNFRIVRKRTNLITNKDVTRALKTAELELSWRNSTADYIDQRKPIVSLLILIMLSFFFTFLKIAGALIQDDLSFRVLEKRLLILPSTNQEKMFIKYWKMPKFMKEQYKV